MLRTVRPHFFNKGFKRFYAPGRGQADIFVFGDPDDYRVAIPLPQIGTRVFALSDRQKVRSFIRSLQIEDPHVTSVSIKDAQGVTISGNTTTEELLQHDWTLQLNDQVFPIKSPPPAKEGRYRQIQAHPQFKEIASYLEEKGKESSTLELDEFHKHLQNIGIDTETANEILETLSELGYVLHLDNNIEHHHVIFLKPQNITSALDTMLNLPGVQQSFEQKSQKLQSLRAKFAPMEALEKQCHETADKSAHAIATAGFIGLCAQFIIFARLTWWESDWDVMEPITWFTTVLETIILTKFYFLWTGSEFAHYELRQALYLWKLKSHQKRTGFDPLAFKQLKQKIGDLEAELQFGEPKN